MTGQCSEPNCDLAAVGWRAGFELGGQVTTGRPGPKVQTGERAEFLAMLQLCVICYPHLTTVISAYAVASPQKP